MKYLLATLLVIVGYLTFSLLYYDTRCPDCYIGFNKSDHQASYLVCAYAGLVVGAAAGTGTGAAIGAGTGVCVGGAGAFPGVVVGGIGGGIVGGCCGMVGGLWAADSFVRCPSCTHIFKR